MNKAYWTMDNWGADYPPENADEIISAANEQIDKFAYAHDEEEEIINFSEKLWEQYCSGSKAWEIIAGGLYDSAVALMDDDIREDLHRDLAPCTDIEFLSAYMEKHLEKYGIEFVI